MSLSLKEWEKVQEYAHFCAEKLNFNYYLNVKVKVYRMFGGAVGISLQLFDRYDNFFKEYLSGTHSATDEYIKSIKSCYFRIKEEAGNNA